jgi:predicted transposase/invertase (TIGR01784 family)
MAFKPGKLLDPKADLVFKKVFGNNKDLVKSFLNSVLPLKDDELIETVEYLTPEQAPRTPIQKYSVVDVRCFDQHGRIFIVEMQMGWSPSFWSRLQFGTAKAYVDQLKKGEAYEFLNPVYGLALIGEIFDPQTEEWYHHYKTVNIKNTDKQIKGLELIFVELPKFKATTLMEKKLGILWLRFLNEISRMKDIPHEFTDVPEICKAIELTQEASYTKEELAQYDGYWDQVSCEKTIKTDARREGKAEGLAEAKAEVALKLILKNLDDETIVECSGLTFEELYQLKKSLYK